MAAALPFIAVGISAIGAGMQYVASNQAAKSQASIATLNAQNANLAAKQQFDLQILNTQMESRRAEQSADLQRLQGANLDAEAENADKIAMQNAAKSREEMARFRAIQRSRIAGSGVVETGTPLDALAESAADMQLALSSGFYADVQAGREKRFEAGLAKTGASLLQAEAGQILAKGGFAKSNLTATLAQNNVERLAGMANARNTRLQGVASLIGNVGDMAYKGYQTSQNKPR
jgi:hypothetical protein